MPFSRLKIFSFFLAFFLIFLGVFENSAAVKNQFIVSLNKANAFTTTKKSINLRKMGLKYFPIATTFCSQLEKVNLSQNLIKFFPDEFKLLPNLKEINLGSNLIEEIPIATLKNLFSLEIFNLKKNKIDFLPLDEWLEALPNLKELDIRGNPLPQQSHFKKSKNIIKSPTSSCSFLSSFFLLLLFLFPFPSPLTLPPPPPFTLPVPTFHYRSLVPSPSFPHYLQIMTTFPFLSFPPSSSFCLSSYLVFLSCIPFFPFLPPIHSLPIIPHPPIHRLSIKIFLFYYHSSLPPFYSLSFPSPSPLSFNFLVYPSTLPSLPLFLILSFSLSFSFSFLVYLSTLPSLLPSFPFFAFSYDDIFPVPPPSFVSLKRERNSIVI